MKTLIHIISTEPVKDDEGFVNCGDRLLATVRSYKEDRHGNEAWKNRASFSTATSLFRFRKIPEIEITTDLFIDCDAGRYNILSSENIKGRGMYVEVLCEKIEASEG